ncbi:hypothetical protein AMECASPLE_021385, partial [Ameca splendens]
MTHPEKALTLHLVKTLERSFLQGLPSHRPHQGATVWCSHTAAPHQEQSVWRLLKQLGLWRRGWIVYSAEWLLSVKRCSVVLVLSLLAVSKPAPWKTHCGSVSFQMVNTSLNLPQDPQDQIARLLLASPALPVHPPTPSTIWRNPLTRHACLSTSVSVACSLLPRINLTT